MFAPQAASRNRTFFASIGSKRVESRWFRRRAPEEPQEEPMTAPAARPPAGSFVAELEAQNPHPLWDRYQRITPIKPQPPDTPFLWRWREVEPYLHRSVGEVAINDIERRALIMAHPAFGAETTTTSTLLAAFTVLDPGERARPHRHTGAAVRLATRAEGAVTIVNGRRCEMKAGDLILTPPMVWHGHIN